MKKIKICFVSMEGSPNFLGGSSLFHKNLIKYIYSKRKDISISWVYFGKENKKYVKKNVEYFELKNPHISSPLLLKRSFILSKFFKKNYFDIINTPWGIWTNFYKKQKNQKIVHAFHGTAYYFNKNHFRRFGFLKKILMLPLLASSFVVDKPSKEIDKIICVSEKVKRQVENLYGKKKNIFVIRTGVDLENFMPRDKSEIRKKLNLDKNKIYGLYVGGGGYWTKGLDRAIKLGKEIYDLNKNFRLIVIGPDYKKVKHLLGEPFVKFLRNVPREKMPFYYSASDIFFCMSRYEGGAPTLVVSEAMASGCLVVCAKSAEQEIIENEKNGLIINNYGKKEAVEILENIRNKRIINNSIKKIKELSLEKWGEKYLAELEE